MSWQGPSLNQGARFSNGTVRESRSLISPGPRRASLDDAGRDGFVGASPPSLLRNEPPPVALRRTVVLTHDGSESGGLFPATLRSKVVRAVRRGGWEARREAMMRRHPPNVGVLPARRLGGAEPST